MSTPNVVATPIAPYRTLVVEDDAGVSAFLVETLSSAGWDVVVATRLSEAMLAIGDTTRPIDLAIIDVRLPDGDGRTTFHELRQRRDIPEIVLMTGFRDDEMLVEAIREGVIDFLTKPFGAHEVSGMLRRRTIRERQRLGIMAGRFERVDADFALVRKELSAVRAAVESWGDWWMNLNRAERARGSTG